MKRRIPVILFGLASLATVFLGRIAERPDARAPARGKGWTLIAGSILASAFIAGAAYLGASQEFVDSRSRAVPHLQKYGCAGCHTIPGVPNAVGHVGPPLAGLAQRTFVGGTVRNESEALAEWIVDPPKGDPHTGMPRTGISISEARDVVDYLYRR
jgi:cytochrome c1